MNELFADTNMNDDLDRLLEWLDSDGRGLWAEAVRMLRVELDEVKRERDVYNWRWRSLQADRDSR